MVQALLTLIFINTINNWKNILGQLEIINKTKSILNNPDKL